ncbi:PREDICTED: uncharacterized protein LOC105512722 [Colobus angolensis palliatus]|uniref:uncharacterized protein LOC105512722 n=1 Tax=Colobus angolensis palliatus TaxID=336983 RepID=UPI0005F5302D|nr:PREDICTED: uncharacterized protein LOC105512722 [Colobus angolensis palliatus]
MVSHAVGIRDFRVKVFSCGFVKPQNCFLQGPGAFGRHCLLLPCCCVTDKIEATWRQLPPPLTSSPAFMPILRSFPADSGSHLPLEPPSWASPSVKLHSSILYTYSGCILTILH